MQNIDSKKLEKLISAKKWDQVKELLGNFFETVGKDPADKGEKYVKFAHLYAKVNLALQEQYLKQLEKSIATLTNLNKTESKIDDKINIGKAKKKALAA